MTHRTMSRLPLLLIALVASSTASSLVTSRARAQTAYRNITEVHIGGEKKEVATPVFINLEECREEFTFKLTNIATMIPVMEAWASTTADCTQPMNRSRINNNDPPCWEAGEPATGVSGQYEFTIPGPEIFSPDGGSCPTGLQNQPFTVYFVPLTSSGDFTGSMAPAPIPGAVQASAQFTLSTKLPAPLANVRAYGGENELRVTWDRADINPRTRYRAFFDYGTGGPGKCGSGVLDGVPVASSDAGVAADAAVPGMGGIDAAVGDASLDAALDGTPADAATGVDTSGDPGGSGSDSTEIRPPPPGTPFVKVVSNVRGESTSLSDLSDIPIGSQVQVAVSMIDATGNVGYLSERQCVTRVETTSFIDACELSAECELDSCSASSGRTGSAVGLSLFALALTALIRRRRSA